MNTLMHTKGHAAPETRAAAKRAHLLIKNSEALGEPPEDPLLTFSVLWSFWVANFGAFNGDLVRELARELLTLAEKQRASVPLMIAGRSTGLALLHTGDIAEWPDDILIVRLHSTSLPHTVHLRHVLVET